jgi:hypothetical protein
MNEDQPSIESLCLTVIVIAVLGCIGVLAIAYFEAVATPVLGR